MLVGQERECLSVEASQSLIAHFKKAAGCDSDPSIGVVLTAMVVGHSLGGALAVLNAMVLLNLGSANKLDVPPGPLAQGTGKDYGVNHVFLYTAACPPVLTQEAKEFLQDWPNLVTIHACHFKDIVPMAPYPTLVQHAPPVIVGTPMSSWGLAPMDPSYACLFDAHSMETYDTTSLTFPDAFLLYLRTSCSWKAYKLKDASPQTPSGRLRRAGEGSRIEKLAEVLVLAELKLKAGAAGLWPLVEAPPPTTAEKFWWFVKNVAFPAAYFGGHFVGLYYALRA